MADIVLDRQTIITFPNRTSGQKEFITGIGEGTLLINRFLADGNLEFGKATSNRFEVDLYDCGDVGGEKIIVKQMIDNTPKTLFTGYVDSAKLDDMDYYRHIIAYDSVYTKGSVDVASWWNTFWTNKNSATIRELRLSLCEFVGITCELKTLVNDNVTVSKDIEIATISFTDMLSYICMLSCCIPNVKEDDTLEFVVLETSVSKAMDLTDLYESGSKFEDYNVQKITKVAITDSEGNIVCEVGSGTNTYTISKNILLFNRNADQLNTVATNILNQIKDITYKPCEIKMIVSNLDLGMGALVKTNKGYSYVMENELSGIMLVEQSLICTGDEVREEVTESYNAEYTILSGKTAKMELTIDGLTTKVGEISQEASEAKEDASGAKTQASEAYTLATQTATKFSWIVSGTSQSSITLTDKMAEIVADTISLNGNVKVNGAMIVDGCITAKELALDAIKSQNYVVNKSGSFLNLADGSFDSKNLKWDKDGSVNCSNINITGGKIDIKASLKNTEFIKLLYNDLQDGAIDFSVSMTPVDFWMREVGELSDTNLKINSHTRIRAGDIDVDETRISGIGISLGNDSFSVGSKDNKMAGQFTVNEFSITQNSTTKDYLSGGLFIEDDVVSIVCGSSIPNSDRVFLQMMPLIGTIINGNLSVNGTINGYVKDDDSRLSDARTPKAHNQSSNTITAMTGYSKPSSTSAIATSDTLNSAIGKLEKALDNKLALTGGTLTGDLYSKNNIFQRTPKSVAEIKGATSGNTNRFIRWQDKDGVILAQLVGKIDYTGKREVYLQACRQDGTTDKWSSYLGIGIDESGNEYTFAPTPTKTDNSTKIATTAFIKTLLGDYILKSGGTMTGDIVLKDRLQIVNGNYTKDVLSIVNPSTTTDYGAELMVGAGGNLFVGSGESNTSVRTNYNTTGVTLKTDENYNKGNEVFYLTSDNAIYLITNANTFANRKVIMATTKGNFVPLDKDQTLGSTTHFWDNVYTKELTVNGTSVIKNEIDDSQQAIVSFSDKTGKILWTSEADGSNIINFGRDITGLNMINLANVVSILGDNVTFTGKANKDGDGNTISSTYLKLSGGTINNTSANQLTLQRNSIQGAQFSTAVSSTSEYGFGRLQLGNATACAKESTNKGTYGTLTLYGSNTGACIIRNLNQTNTSTYTVECPQQSGTLLVDKDIKYVAGNTINYSGTSSYGGYIPCAGYLSAGNKGIQFFYPTEKNPVGLTATVNTLSLTVRAMTGNSNNSFLHYNDGTDKYVDIGNINMWSNDAENSAYPNSVVSVTATPKHNGLWIVVSLKYNLCKTNTGTSQENNIPLSVQPTAIKITFS